jgi:hypothetical protein
VIGRAAVLYAKCRTEQAMRHDYSDKKLETFNMPITQRCNYAGPFGQLIPTRSFAFALMARLRGLRGLRR